MVVEIIRISVLAFTKLTIVCASFVLSNKSQWNVCFNWRNLQPMWGLENTVKKDQYSEQDEMAWIKE